MTTINDNPLDKSTAAFWLMHPDPFQAAVHLALRWVVYVYPSSEMHIDRILKSALPYTDTDISSTWPQLLEQQDVEGHVEALKWIADNLSEQKIPFLVESWWRLLLVDHELPTQVPLALRIIGQVLEFEESQQLAIGADVFTEYTKHDPERKGAPLLPANPRYLDRIEWRLSEQLSMPRRTHFPVQNQSGKGSSRLYGFIAGSVFGAVLVGGLVFGPLQLGRLKVPILVHDGLLIERPVEPLSSVTPAGTAQSAIEQSAPAAVNPGIESLAPGIIAAQPVTASVAATSVVKDVLVVKDVPAVAEAPSMEPVVSVNEQDALSTVDNAILVRQLTESPAVDWMGARVLMEVTASILNVRREPLVDSEVLIKLATGARVWAYPGQAGGLWMAIKVEGEAGYASARFLAEVAPP